jgi:hypothetical protein
MKVLPRAGPRPIFAVAAMTFFAAWTHLDPENNPAMVDISGLQSGTRTTVAELLLPVAG